jgi:hypothetical protein
MQKDDYVRILCRCGRADEESVTGEGFRELLMTDSDIEDSGGEGAERINTDRITANRMLMLG